MGRKKKPFIDKRRATTYHLVHREIDENDEDDGDYELVSTQEMGERRQEAAAAAGRHPMSFLFVTEDDMVQNDQQRDEIRDMGLPDDGYNYLQHLRAPGSQTLLAVAGTSTAGKGALQSVPEELCLDGDGEHQLFLVCMLSLWIRSSFCPMQPALSMENCSCREDGHRGRAAAYFSAA